MSVQLEALSVQELRVHLRGQWVLVEEVAVHCGFSWRRSEDRLVFTVAYSGCGVKSEGGVYSLTLLWGEREVTLSCPAVLPPAPPPPGTAAPPPRPPSLLCRKTRMWAVLPSARPDSLQVRDRSGVWRPVGGAAPLCAYEVKRGDEGGVVFSSPLPGCDSRTLAPSLLSLPLRFHDDALLRWRTLDLRCPVAPGQTPPTPPRTTDHPGPRPSPHPLPAPLQPRVTCGQQHLSVDLPRGPVRGIAVRSE
nr:PREDICTED: protein enabled homolog isoform X3 [Lepisosteus oculatus]